MVRPPGTGGVPTKSLAVGGLLLYGVANLFGGVFDLITERSLPPGVDVALVVTGGIGAGPRERERTAPRSGSRGFALSRRRDVAAAVGNCWVFCRSSVWSGTWRAERRSNVPEIFPIVPASAKPIWFLAGICLGR